MLGINGSRRWISHVTAAIRKGGKAKNDYRGAREVVSDLRLSLEPLEDRRLLAVWYPDAVAEMAAARLYRIGVNWRT